MQKIFFIQCCALVLLCSTSCEEHMDIEHCPISQDVNVPNPKLKNSFSKQDWEKLKLMMLWLFATVMGMVLSKVFSI